jgi:hypothetical protein
MGLSIRAAKGLTCILPISESGVVAMGSCVAMGSDTGRDAISPGSAA